MATAKVKDRYQVTIPKEVRRQFECQVGDSLEVVCQGGRIVMTPQQVISKPAVAKLSRQEQQLLQIVQDKLEKIGSDHVNSVGLTKDEIRVGVKVGLIDADEWWWYTEEWQEGEREATRDEAEGRVSEPLETAEDIDNYFASLHES